MAIHLADVKLSNFNRLFLLRFHNKTVKRIVMNFLAAIQIQLLQSEGIAVLVQHRQHCLVHIFAVLERQNLNLSRILYHLLEIKLLHLLFKNVLRIIDYNLFPEYGRLQAALKCLGGRHEAQLIIFFEVLEDNNDDVPWQILEVLLHVLHSQYHIIKSFLNFHLLDPLSKLLNPECTLLLSLKSLWNVKEFQDLIRPNPLVTTMRLHGLQLNPLGFLCHHLAFSSFLSILHSTIVLNRHSLQEILEKLVVARLILIQGTNGLIESDLAQVCLIVD